MGVHRSTRRMVRMVKANQMIKRRKLGRIFHGLLGIGIFLAIGFSSSIGNNKVQSGTQPTPVNSQVITITQSKMILGNEKIQDVKWSPDGLKLSSNEEGKTLVWDTTSWQLLFTISEPIALVSAWSPDSQYIATPVGINQQEHVMIWDANNGELLEDFVRPPYEETAVVWISQIAWSQDGNKIATNASNGGALIWDVLTGNWLVADESLYKRTIEVTFSPDSTKLASGIAIWDAQTGEKLMDIRGQNWIVWNPVEDIIATSGPKRDSFQIIDGKTGEVIIARSGHSHNVISLAWSFDGHFLATASVDNTVMIWNAETWEHIATIAGDLHELNSVTWNPNGTEIATGSKEGTLIWDTSPLVE